MEEDDYKLIKACCAGNKQAWDRFVIQYGRLIYSTIIKCLYKNGRNFDQDIVADLFNDVFVCLLKKDCKALRDFESRNECKFSTYLRMITFNKSIDYLRRIKKEICLDENSQELEHTARAMISDLALFKITEDMEKLDAAIFVQRLIKILNGKEKRICDMLYFEGKAPKEIADELHVTIGNFYMMKQRMLKKLRNVAINEKNI